MHAVGVTPMFKLKPEKGLSDYGSAASSRNMTSSTGTGSVGMGTARSGFTAGMGTGRSLDSGSSGSGSGTARSAGGSGAGVASGLTHTIAALLSPLTGRLSENQAGSASTGTDRGVSHKHVRRKSDQAGDTMSVGGHAGPVSVAPLPLTSHGNGTVHGDGDAASAGAPVLERGSYHGDGQTGRLDAFVADHGATNDPDTNNHADDNEPDSPASTRSANGLIGLASAEPPPAELPTMAAYNRMYGHGQGQGQGLAHQGSFLPAAVPIVGPQAALPTAGGGTIDAASASVPVSPHADSGSVFPLATGSNATTVTASSAPARRVPQEIGASSTAAHTSTNGASGSQAGGSATGVGGGASSGPRLMPPRKRGIFVASTGERVEAPSDTGTGGAGSTSTSPSDASRSPSGGRSAIGSSDCDDAGSDGDSRRVLPRAEWSCDGKPCSEWALPLNFAARLSSDARYSVTMKDLRAITQAAARPARK